ncbi:MAG: drug/metabolite transporter (DMT)-like permease [Gammaproteobacteria bacterium]|jgi:drug/metabolite transporter (DMT)-like permease
MQKLTIPLNSISTRSNRVSLGITITIIGGLCFSIQDAGIKWLTVELAVIQVLFLRSLFGMAFLGVSTIATGERISRRVKRPGLLLVRTVINILSWIFFFGGLKYLPLATAVALFFSFPLFLAITSVPILGEKVGLRRSFGIIVGFIGVLFITNPTSGIEWPMLMMLAAAFGWALVANITRILGETENTSTMLFYTLFGFAVVLAVPQFWIWQPINLQTLGLIASITIFGVIAQFCLTKAYSIASPSLIAPFEYTALIWSATLGFLIWGDVPDIYAMIGAALIVGSGLYIIHRETIVNRTNRAL